MESCSYWVGIEQKNNQKKEILLLIPIDFNHDSSWVESDGISVVVSGIVGIVLYWVGIVFHDSNQF